MLRVRKRILACGQQVPYKSGPPGRSHLEGPAARTRRVQRLGGVVHPLLRSLRTPALSRCARHAPTVHCDAPAAQPTQASAWRRLRSTSRPSGISGTVGINCLLPASQKVVLDRFSCAICCLVCLGPWCLRAALKALACAGALPEPTQGARYPRTGGSAGAAAPRWMDWRSVLTPGRALLLVHPRGGSPPRATAQRAQGGGRGRAVGGGDPHRLRPLPACLPCCLPSLDRRLRSGARARPAWLPAIYVLEVEDAHPLSGILTLWHTSRFRCEGASSDAPPGLGTPLGRPPPA